MRARELAAFLAAVSLLTSVAIAQSDEPAGPSESSAERHASPTEHETQSPSRPAGAVEEPEPHFSGMDEAVNVDLAEKAGAPVRKPYIDVESLGELWNLILLMGGAVCGFVVGRYWNQIWGRPK